MEDATPPLDGDARDSVVFDAEPPDAPGMDGTGPDAGPRDSGGGDTSADVRMDSSPPDSSPPDTGPPDTGPPDTGSGCPSGYSMNVVGTCYRPVTSPTADWQSAERDCESDGAHIVVIDDATEDGLIPDRSWIGYTETVTADAWLWVTGSGASSYDGFASGEPRAGGAACAVQRSDGWHDDNCYELKAYVCEFDGRAADPATWR